MLYSLTGMEKTPCSTVAKAVTESAPSNGAAVDGADANGANGNGEGEEAKDNGGALYDLRARKKLQTFLDVRRCETMGGCTEVSESGLVRKLEMSRSRGQSGLQPLGFFYSFFLLFFFCTRMMRLALPSSVCGQKGSRRNHSEWYKQGFGWMERQEAFTAPLFTGDAVLPFASASSAASGVAVSAATVYQTAPIHAAWCCLMRPTAPFSEWPSAIIVFHMG